MLEIHYVAYCDGCADSIPLTGKTKKECVPELQNLGWVPDKGTKHWYCPACITKRDYEARASQSSPEGS